MKVCTVRVEDEVNCVIGGLRPEHLEVLSDRFAVMVDGAWFMPAFQLKRWDGRVRFFERTGRTYTKLLDEVVPYLTAWDYEVDLVDKRLPAPVIAHRINEDVFGLKDDPEAPYQLRPYQVDVVNALLAEGSGFAIAATGSGKTAMVAALALVLFTNGLQTLIIVPSSDLVTQTVDELREHLRLYQEVTVGEYSGATKDADHPIVVGTWQALQNAPHYLGCFQAVVVDEAHGCKANVIKDLINVHGRNISHRYGCTGTFPKAEADKYNLKASIGRVVSEVPARWLIDQGYLAEIEIEPLETLDADPDLPDYASERAYLTGLDERNVALARYIERKRDAFGNTLVLVNTQSLAQGRFIVDQVEGAVYLDGTSKSDLRRQNYLEYATRDDVIVVASAGIASIGISIDRIFCLILLDTGRSFFRCIQSVGRGMRRKGDKNLIHVVDVSSKLKYAKKHWKERKKYYAEAQYPLLAVEKLKY